MYFYTDGHLGFHHYNHYAILIDRRIYNHEYFVEKNFRGEINSNYVGAVLKVNNRYLPW